MKDNYSLFFIRHGKLLLPYKDHSEMPFKVLADLASQKLNPPIDKKFSQKIIEQISRVIPLKEIGRIYASPSRRCRESAILISYFIKKNFQKKIRIVILPKLKEISFDLNKILAPLGQDSIDIKKINNYVLSAMLKGKDCEAVKVAYQRVNYILNKKNNSDQKNKVLFITHDFFMRVIEIYIKHGGKINPKITFNDLKNTKRNYYLHGFATDFKLSHFFTF